MIYFRIYYVWTVLSKMIIFSVSKTPNSSQLHELEFDIDLPLLFIYSEITRNNLFLFLLLLLVMLSLLLKFSLFPLLKFPYLNSVQTVVFLCIVPTKPICTI